MKLFKLLLLPAFLLMTSCLDDISQSKPDYGPEVSEDQVADALNSTVGDRDPATALKIGQFALTTELQVLNEQFGTILSDQLREVVSRTETADKITFGTVMTKITYNHDGTNQKETAEGDPIIVNKTAVASVSELETMSAGGELSVREMTEKKFKASAARVTFHNLTLSSRVVSPPARVVADDNCRGIPNCQVKVYDLSFDQVYWETDYKATRLHFDYTISPEVPYMAQFLNQCVTYLASMDPKNPESALIKVKQCYIVEDFRLDSSN
jgi:hypothetical protein